jgi:antibiotic biosynthesis monooxygenase (ABM) superfamily enzyme
LGRAGAMKARATFDLLAWLGAFLIVMALFVAFGAQLEDLPLPLRALAISGVLVVSMTQVVTPLINRFLRFARRNAANR